MEVKLEYELYGQPNTHAKYDKCLQNLVRKPEKKGYV